MTIPRLRLTCLAMSTLAIAAACSSSDNTGPNVTIAQIAQHYDQLAGLYLNGGGEPPQIGANIALFNGGPANGVQPSTPTVANAPVFQHGWLGNVIDLVDSAGQDSVQFVSFWYTGTVLATIQVTFQNAQFDSATAVDSGSSYLKDSVGTGSVSLSPVTGACAFTTVVNISTPPTYDPSGSTCSLIAGTVSANLFFPQADSSFTAMYFPNPIVSSQRMTGVRLQYASSATFASAVAHTLGRH
jgi:hypothetical protein